MVVVLLVMMVGLVRGEKAKRGAPRGGGLRGEASWRWGKGGKGGWKWASVGGAAKGR